jgi:hypothetical protein
MDPSHPPKPRLSSEGQIYVTLAAAEQWLDANDFGGLEEARRDLTELLLDAYRQDGDPGQVRYRSKSEGIDLQARVVPEGRLIVVVSIHVRDHVSGRGARNRDRDAARRRVVR